MHKGNALGSKAIASVALGQLNPPLATDVTNGTVNVLTQVLGLTDLTGQNAAGFSIGIVDATVDPAKGAWPTGAAPEDWDFLADPAVISMGLPTGKLGNGKIVDGAITAGPSTVVLTLNLGGSPASLQMNNASISGTVAGTKSAPGDLPADLKLESGLEAFDTISAATDGTQGLCGDITVTSLAQIPIPQALTTGEGDCTQGYTYCGAGAAVGANCNSLLDVLVGGCTVVGGLVTAVNKTQPDVPGNGTAIQTLTVGAKKKVTLPANDTDAYSSYLTFAMLREHFSGESCTTATECQETPAAPSTAQSCTAAVCTPR